MKIKMISKSGVIPEYKTEGASGMDIRAYLDGPLVMHPMERMLVPTGLFIELPPGYEAQTRARSGLAVKYGIGLVNGIGTIDSDYRGELKVPLINWGSEDFVINNGDRIAQMVIAKYEKVEIELTDSLEETERGTGGFGHTGI
ncbi:dUTP diphosphatase [Mobilibacterium timonense]|uniref:dUTP diphosphatase n=1 Tax=Mobilibacterium timonense TaxID=1871012 RepID=UPI0009862ECC|nr:dUTP diphosphatase [Mobilibacterium timonense]